MTTMTPKKNALQLGRVQGIVRLRRPFDVSLGVMSRQGSLGGASLGQSRRNWLGETGAVTLNNAYPFPL